MDLVSSTVALGAAGAGGDDYWFSLHWNNTSSEAVLFYNLDLDASGNVVLTGDTQKSDIYGTLPNNHKGTAHKINGTDGSAIWHRFASHQTTYANSDYFDITADEDDNVYITGTRPYIASGSDAGNNGMAILKFNSSGSLQWQKDFRAKNTGNSWQGMGVVPGSSNGVTVSVGREYDNRYGIRLVEMAANGTVSTDKHYEYTYNNLALEPNVYPVLARGSTDGYYYVTGSTGNNKNFVAQIRANWTWRGLTLFDSPSGELQSQGIALDDSDNQYVLAGNQSTKMFLYKVNRSNQTVAWQKNIANAFDQYRRKSIVCKNGKVFVCGTKSFTQGSSNQQALVIVAFNQSDGSIDSAIRIRNYFNSKNIRGFGIAATDTALVASAQVYMNTGGHSAGGVFKIPLDFSLTGQHTIGNQDTVYYETWSASVSTSTQGTNAEFTSVTVNNVNTVSSGNYTIYNVNFTETQSDID